MFNNKKMVIFDLDQTLIDSGDVWNHVDEELIFRLTKEHKDLIELTKKRDEIFATCEDGSNKYLKYFEYIANYYNLSLTKEEINKINDDVCLDLLRTQIDYKEDADKLLNQLKNNGYKIVLATTSPKYMVDIYLNENKKIISKADMKEIFDGIYTKESVKYLKPNPEIYIKILNDFNIDAKDAIVIEDSLEGIISAKKAGIEVIAMYDKINDMYRDEINNNADYKYDSFKELIEKELTK